LKIFEIDLYYTFYLVMKSATISAKTWSSCYY